MLYQCKNITLTYNEVVGYNCNSTAIYSFFQQTAIKELYYCSNFSLYDPALCRMLSPDNYITNPRNPQAYNRYTYCLNNPLKYTDPSGNYVIIDDIIAAAIGGVINLATNAIQGNLSGHGFWGGVGRGFAAFGAGAIGGLGALYPEFGGWVWGGATVGATNAWLSGAKSGDIFQGAIVGGISGVFGGLAGNWAGQYLGGVVINGFNVTSPVLKGIIAGGISGSAGGYAGGFTAGYLITGNIDDANKAGLKGLYSGAAIGAGIGGIVAYKQSINNQINPWSGKPNKSFTIGEGMEDRVKPVAKDLNSEKLKLPDELQPGYIGKDMIDPRAMDYNSNIIEIKMQQDYYFFDVGPRGNNIRSSFYNMEVGRTMDYPKVYYVHMRQIGIIRILIIYK